MKVKRTKKWHKHLTIKELRHLNEVKTNTLRDIKKQINIGINPNTGDPFCWDCHFIGKKLMQAGVIK